MFSIQSIKRVVTFRPVVGGAMESARQSLKKGVGKQSASKELINGREFIF